MRYVWQHKNWPRFRWDSLPLVEGIGKARLRQGLLIAQVQDLGFDLSREAEMEAVSEETLKTAAIEGERLPLASVRSSVARRLGLPTAGMPPPERPVDGLVQVLLDATKNHDQPLTEKRLLGWHAALFPTGYSGMNRIPAGKWRRHDPMRVVSGPVGRERVHFEAPPSRLVRSEISRFLAWWQTSFGKTEGLLRAGIAHFHFVTIHPFADGNGRLARALTDMALAQDEGITTRFYSLSSQIMAERDAYYDVLERSQRGDGDATLWLVWFLGCLERALRHSETLIARVLEKAGFWRRHAETPLNARQRKVINRLLEVGAGKFEGGVTTRKYMSLTRTSRATAYRELSDLVTKGVLLPNEGRGRSASYELAP